MPRRISLAHSISQRINTIEMAAEGREADEKTYK